MVHQYRGIYAGTLYTRRAGPRPGRADRHPEPRPGPGVRGRPGAEHARRPRAAGRLGAAAVAGRRAPDLTQVLRLDPRAVVEPLEHDHLQITLIDPGRALDDLMPIALTNRPELASRRALIEAADGGDPPGEGAPAPPQRRAQRLPDPRRHVDPGRDLRPGPQQQPQPVDGPRRRQHPAHVAARKLRVRQPRADQAAARSSSRRPSSTSVTTQDMVAEEVNQAHARVQSAAARVVQADRALRTGIITFNGNCRGPGADQPVRRRPGPDHPAAGGGLRTPALDTGLRRVLHDGGRVQPGAVRAVPRAGLPRPGGPAPPAPPGEVLPVDPTRPLSCRRWATGRPRPPDERRIALGGWERIEIEERRSENGIRSAPLLSSSTTVQSHSARSRTLCLEVTAACHGAARP